MTPAYLKNKQLEVLLPGFESTTFRLAFRMFYHGAIGNWWLSIQSVLQTLSIIVQSVVRTLYHRLISTSDDLSPFNQYFRPFITVVLICNDDANKIGKISLVI